MPAPSTSWCARDRLRRHRRFDGRHARSTSGGSVELTGRPVAPLLQAGSGSAFWYLALKNWVVASGIKPRMVFIFFRDTNLTDVMFRLDEQFRWSLDIVAHDREDELNAVVAGACRARCAASRRRSNDCIRAEPRARVDRAGADRAGRREC